MRYRLEIAEHLVQQLDGLPTPVRKSLFGGLYLAAQALGTSRGKRAWGERVQNFSPPMYILTSQGHRLLYEVDTRAHALLVRSLAQPQAEEPPPAPLQACRS